MGWETSEVASVFDREAAYAAIQSVAAKLGVRATEAELLGPIADNAVFRVPGHVVARISTASTYERALREVRTGRWLAAQGVPAVKPLESADLPWSVDGYVVTLWHEVPDASMASTAELANLLQQLHTVPVRSDFEIPLLDPLIRLEEHLAAADGALAHGDRRFLDEGLEQLRQEYARVSPGLPVSVIHGDANRKNAIRGRDGVAAWRALGRGDSGHSRAR